MHLVEFFQIIPFVSQSCWPWTNVSQADIHVHYSIQNKEWTKNICNLNQVIKRHFYASWEWLKIDPLSFFIVLFYHLRLYAFKGWIVETKQGRMEFSGTWKISQVIFLSKPSSLEDKWVLLRFFYFTQSVISWVIHWHVICRPGMYSVCSVSN